MPLLRLLTLVLASAALYTLIVNPPRRMRPALAGEAVLVMPAAPIGAPAPIGASAGQAEPWPGFGDAVCAGYHAGAVDFCAPAGTVVVAPASGTLTEVGAYGDTLRYGAYVIITTPAGLEIYLGHLNHETVNPLGLAVGAWVPAGTPIGDLSEFAYSQPHSHVQLRRGGALIGPGEWWAAWEGR